MKNTKSAVDEKNAQQEELVQIRQDDPREKRRQYMRSYYQANKEKKRQYMRLYYKENEEKMRKYMHSYYKANKEIKRQYMRSYYKENKEKLRPCRLAYYMANKEKLRQYRHAYHIENKEKLNKRAADYYKTNKLKHFATVDNYRYSDRNKPITSTERFLRMYFRRKNPVTSFLVERTGFCISDYFNQFDLRCLNLFGETKPYSEIGKSIKLSFGKIYSFPDDTPLSVIFDPKNIILTKKAK